MRSAHLLALSPVVFATACFFTLAPLERLADQSGEKDGSAPIDAPEEPSCGDTSNDPESCGACGHRCLGGTCAAGLCQPIVLASGQVSPACLVNDASDLYWGTAGNDLAEQQALRSVPLAGGAVRTLNTQSGVVLDCALDLDNFYFVVRGVNDIRFVTKSGTNLSYATTTVTPVPTLAADVVAGRLYWVDAVDGGFDIVAGQLALTTTGTVLVSTPDRPYATTFDQSALFWSSRVASTIATAPKLGGAPTILSDAGGAPGRLVPVDGFVYWADQGGAIYRVPQAGGAASVVASDDPGPEALAVDATHVYWVNSSAGTVRRAPIQGGSSELLASGQKNPWRIVVDATAIYWIENHPLGTVMKLAK